jgi:membrane associated rhomboid family serine protease
VTDELDTADWECVLEGPRGAMTEAGFVLTAVAIEHRIELCGRISRLLVPPSQLAQAMAELESYQQENRPLPGSGYSVPTVDGGWAGVLGYLMVIWLQPSLEANQAFGWDWREAGHLQAGLVAAGEWWRCITALTLHGDLGHIVANSLFGSLFGLYVGRYLGSGFGWLLILASGALGNAMNAWIQPDAFSSIGASTASFGALGVSAAFVWRRGYYRNRDWRRSLAPIFAGIALLAFTGTGGENTDVVAHFTGFAAGALLGAAAAAFDIRRLGVSGQYLAGAAAITLVVTAWSFAGTVG